MNRLFLLIILLTSLVLPALGGVSAHPPRKKAQPGPSAPRREDGKVWIENVQPWKLDKMANSVMGVLASATRSLGEDVSYEYLMGLSGSAFRLQFHEEWCPSSPHSFCGVETFQGAMNALPYNLVHHEVKKDDPAGVKKIRAAVKASIDRGVPVLYGSEEEGLIVGYQKGGEEWLCVHPYRFQEGRFVETKLPWEVRILSGKRTPPSRLACLRESLAGAVKLSETKASGK